MNDSTHVNEAELQAFIDGQLDKRRHTNVLAYLGRHPDQLERLAQYAAQKDELRHRLDALDWDDDPTTAQLEQELAERLSGRDRRAWLRRAASIVLLLGAGWWGHVVYDRYLEPRLPSLVVEAAYAHQVFGEDTQRPVELTATTATSRAEMIAWFTRHLGEPIEIPSLDAVGLRLIGGRLLPGGEGPIAQLIYEDGAGHRLTLALSSKPAYAGPEIKLVAVDGLTAGYWQDGELSYAVVAETSEQQLVAIASEIGAQEPEDQL
jgi:anti-sigma factor RsiW